MKKKHSSPEFTVIKQDQANAKFFVASEGPGPGGFTGQSSSEGGPGNDASRYEAGGDIDM